MECSSFVITKMKCDQICTKCMDFLGGSTYIHCRKWTCVGCALFFQGTTKKENSLVGVLLSARVMKKQDRIHVFLYSSTTCFDPVCSYS